MGEMSARIFPFGTFRTKLLKECRSEEALGALHDDFRLCFVILKHAIEKDLPAFTFSDLRIPAVIQQRQAGGLVSREESLAIEVSIFQDHIQDRVTLLAQNSRMLREIWGVNERTRSFRQLELKSPETSLESIDQLTDLLAALEARNEGKAIAALQRSLNRRSALIDSIRPDIAEHGRRGSH
jgi:hypothetical protein